MKSKRVFYTSMLLLGIIFGLSDIPLLQAIGSIVANIYVKIFKCLSAPVLSLSLIVTIATHENKSMGKIWQSTMKYTFGTTIVAALVAMSLYLLIAPESIKLVANASHHSVPHTNYLQYIEQIIPSNLFKPFVDNQVMTLLLLSLIMGFAIRQIPEQESKETLQKFFKGLYSLLFIIIKWVVATLPIGLFGFICVAISQLKSGANLHALGQYLLVVVTANVIQGFIILPLWLKYKGLPGFDSMRKMMPALSLAFLSKSSTGTLPLTIETAEKNLNLRPSISRFVLPLCTSLNMNGCAAFIFTTVVFIMQSNGIEVSLLSMLSWVAIATIAAIGNAGVPMGCYFLSASLLSSMDVPIVLMGLILPFYGIIDMIETALNVWSDSCVANVLNKELPV